MAVHTRAHYLTRTWTEQRLETLLQAECRLCNPCGTRHSAIAKVFRGRDATGEIEPIGEDAVAIRAFGRPKSGNAILAPLMDETERGNVVYGW